MLGIKTISARRALSRAAASPLESTAARWQAVDLTLEKAAHRLRAGDVYFRIPLPGAGRRQRHGIEMVRSAAADLTALADDRTAPVAARRDALAAAELLTGVVHKAEAAPDARVYGGALNDARSITSGNAELLREHGTTFGQLRHSIDRLHAQLPIHDVAAARAEDAARRLRLADEISEDVGEISGAAAARVTRGIDDATASDLRAELDAVAALVRRSQRNHRTGVLRTAAPASAGIFGTMSAYMLAQRAGVDAVAMDVAMAASMTTSAAMFTRGAGFNRSYSSEALEAIARLDRIVSNEGLPVAVRHGAASASQQILSNHGKNHVWENTDRAVAAKAVAELNAMVADVDNVAVSQAVDGRRIADMHAQLDMQLAADLDAVRPAADVVESAARSAELA